MPTRSTAGFTTTVPDRHLKKKLHEAGLGEKKIALYKNDDPDYFKREIELNYEKLSGCGSFDLHKAIGRTNLEIIKAPKNGYTSNFLSTCYFGQAIIYIKPLQRNIDTFPITSQESDGECHTEICLDCGEDVPINNIRMHIEEKHGIRLQIKMCLLL
ncbi:hypothetical protein LOTGIDRAFT_175885 [Lottia gigantea]|uniref:Uncharacterized protein n=1 Tax=Lottia gigantea TaxID=225164 RepID=V3ZBK0_LOTGI|nr:hypothetical protein LOTGIDRAFT_175885 [Lottia gigantea]ESO88388.1 hypothetical protein LOTGIDRAFT_175885 [Lottia gigantea]